MRKPSFLLLASLLLSAPCVQAQYSPSGNSSYDPMGQSTAQPTDCSDPLLADSAGCAQQQSTPPQSQGGFGQGVQSGGNTLPLPGVPASRANTGPAYVDNGGLRNQNPLYNQQQPQRYLRPELLTEFQKFTASTTGQVLPIYGANLFQYVPSTFAPVDQTPVPPEYVLGPGDELRIRVWGQVNFNADVRIDRSGEIYLPQVGQVHVAGVKSAELSQHLRDAIGRVYRNFNLAADVGQIRAIQVYVLGEARFPGTYTVSSLSTLIDTLFASGGPSVRGSLRDIQLKRGGQVITHLDLYKLLANGDKSQDAPLMSGDVLYIPPVGAEVALIGSVRNPAIYEILSGETLTQLIQDAGGASTVAAQSRISIERIENHTDRAEMEVGYDTQGLATELHDGDIVRVLSIVPKYQNTVTLRGNTANPGHFAWHEGMRISDLIPDRDSLLTRNYWWRRTQLGLPSPEFEPVPNLSMMRQPNNAITLPRSANPINAREQMNPGSYGRNGYYGQSAQAGQYNPYDQNNQYDQSGQNNSNTPVAPFGPYDQAVQGLPYGQVSQSPLIDQAAIQNGATSQQAPYYAQGAQPLTARQRAGSGTISAQESETHTENTQGANEHTTVKLPAPDVDWDYAVIERLDPDTLKTTLIPFDLGKLVIDHDASENKLLRPGDVISIFSQADIRVPVAQQTKLVTLEGEFVHAGTYSVMPGETLRQLIERAGGFTPNAYLYGSEFTRESTRVVQQQRIDEYVQSLQLQIQRGSLALASSAASSAQDLASATAATSNERELIARLEQIRATGRIVLELTPGAGGVNAIPDISLEDGDRFIVPSVPANVNVVGSVYDQNSFLYRQRRRVGDYLHLAGGPNRDADRKHIFLIRADGSVVSRETASTIWGNEFENLPVHPGDTLVVPEKTFRPTALRGILDYSQLFSQLALGAAALSYLPL